MSKLKHRAKQALSVVVAVCLAWATVVVPGAFAQGDSSDDGAAALEPQAAAVTAESPYTMTATFDGTELSPTSSNDFTGSWPSGDSKTVSVTLDRGSNVAPDPSKKYVLTMRCSDVFYFNGLPSASKITGVERVAIVKNPAPQVNVLSGKKTSLENFSPYSGEIRMELNTAVDTIAIPDVALNFSPVLAGYTGKAQTVRDPLQIDVVSVDNSAQLGSYASADASTLQGVDVSSVSVTTTASGGNMKNTLSAKGFVDDAITAQNVNVGKDGTIAYAGGTSGQSWQVFSSLKIKFHCPYITVNDEKYYLSFDANDKALTTNKQGNRDGYAMAGNAVYNEADHTISFSFEDVYLGGHTVLFYTPLFSWPSDEAVQDYSVADTLKIEGANWDITEQESYTHAVTSFVSTFSSQYGAYYIRDGANVSIVSSHEASDVFQNGSYKPDIAKREIYSGLTRENGVEGALGFFDIHNNGASDSSELNVSFKFNEGGESSATYYVTKVNLPAYYDPRQDIAVSYVLSNGVDEVSGSKTYVYDRVGRIECSVAALRSACGVGSDYYIKSLEYKTKLQKGTRYHLETAHLLRNRATDQGLFFGYIEGDVGSSASATMSVSSVDGTAVDYNGRVSLSTVEQSEIAEDDYISFAPQKMTFGETETTTASITAGESATLKFSAIVSAEEYFMPNTTVVNGYHVFRDGIFYIALPEGVSILSSEQVTVKGNSSATTAVVDKVQKLDNSEFTRDGVAAVWWAVEASGVNTEGSKALSVSIKLATSNAMQGTTWSLRNCVAIQAKNQHLSWGVASNYSKLYRSTDEMRKSSSALPVQALGNALEDNQSFLGTKFDINVYGDVTEARLSIARAEAKLDVATSLQFVDEPKTSGASLKLSDASKQVEYAVTVSSDEGGYAENFSYYIPIPKTGSAIDPESFVASSDVPFAMSAALKVIGAVSGQEPSSDSPFEVSYTTQDGLTSSNVRGDGVTWVSSLDDWSAVTAVKVSTKAKAQVDEGASYRFVLKLVCGIDQENLEKSAGLKAQWRSFGRYTYVRNDVSTTNTYPSSLNEVAACCVKDLRTAPAMATLDTGATNSYVDVSSKVFDSFKSGQTMRVKTVRTNTGTELVPSELTGLSGSEANSKFKVSFNINNSETGAIPAVNGKGDGNWTVSPSSSMTFQARVSFSKALTDTTTERYVDFVVGNDCVDITWRVKLVRVVAPASVGGSGVAVGASYQVPQVGESCCIARNSAFTALFAVDNYVPVNYSSQTIGLAKPDGATSVELPAGTAITMMSVDANGNVGGYWQYVTVGDETSVDLSSFTRMAGADSDRFVYDTTSDSQTALRYMFVIDFSGVDTGSRLDPQTCSVVFRAEPVKGAENGAIDITRTVTLSSEASFGLSASTDGAANDELGVSLQRTVVKAVGNESYLDGKSLSLVVTPQAGSDPLPADARLVSVDGTYPCNSAGDFIISIGTISEGSAATDFKLKSDMFPDAAKAYSFTARLVLANSSVSEAPSNGSEVASCNFTLKKPEALRPALKVSGVQVAKKTDWVAGPEFNLDVSNIPTGGSVVVNAYRGLAGGNRVTDIFSSVAGVFSVDNGTGTYDSAKKQTGRLVLSNNAQPGTYHLVFEVKDASGQTVLTVPYYFVVR